MHLDFLLLLWKNVIPVETICISCRKAIENNPVCYRTLYEKKKKEKKSAIHFSLDNSIKKTPDTKQ